MIRVEQAQTFPILSIVGDLDRFGVAHLNTSFAILEAEPVLVLSLEKTEYVDSCVLGALVKQFRLRLGRLVVVLPEASPIYRLLAVTGLIEHFHAVSDRTEAFVQAAALRDESIKSRAVSLRSIA